MSSMPNICNLCMACVPPCPTGSIDNWRAMPRAQAYSTEAQLGWDALPAELGPEELGAADASGAALTEAPQSTASGEGEEAAFDIAAYAALIPPWSAASPYANLYGPKAATRSLTANVVGNVRVTEVGKHYDTHHIVLDFGLMPFPVLEGQSIGIIPPGADARTGDPIIHANIPSQARAMRRPGYNNVSLTVKRVLEDHQGHSVRGTVAATISAISMSATRWRSPGHWRGFLMPNHPKSGIVS